MTRDIEVTAPSDRMLTGLLAAGPTEWATVLEAELATFNRRGTFDGFLVSLPGES